MFGRTSAGAVLLGLCGALLLPATPASAHAELLGTTPAAGTHLDRPPSEVTLRFSEQVKPVPDGVRLLGASGHRVGGGSPRAVAEQVRLPVPADLPDGIYVVAWRVVSLDSHPIGGSFSFSVGAASGTATQEDVAQDRVVGGAFWLFRGLGYAALALFAGGVAFLFICWPAGWLDPRARRLVKIGWLSTLVAAVGALLLQGPYVSGDSLLALFDPGLLRATVDTNFGQFVLARIGLLVLAGFLLRRPSLLGLVVLALPVTWAGSGHARAGTGLVLAIAADSVHLLAMAVWLGGLALLFACVLRRASVHEAAAALPRFSRLAMAAIGILVATGAFQAWRELGDAAGGSGYARILVFKVAAFGLLLCLGAGSRALVQYRYVRPVTGVSAKKLRHVERQREVAAFALLRKSVRLELGIAGVVLGLTAALVATSPSGHDHSTPSDYSGPFSSVLALPDGGDVQVWVDPARPGTNNMVLNVRDAEGINRDVPEVRARLSNPAFDAEPMTVPLTRTAAGQFAAPTVTLPTTGTWRLEVWVRTSDVDEETAVAQVGVG